MKPLFSVPSQLLARILLPGMILSAACGVALAEKADRDKPMNIEADSLRQDDIKQVSVFTGRVVLTKGTIVIRGSQLTVRQDPQGFQYATVLSEPGKLAFFRQKREGVDEFIEGESETIEYDGKADAVKFIKRAQLRRYLGATLNDEITGNVISYDNVSEVFSVDGGVTKGSPATTNGRVKAMLTPRAAAAAPGASSSLPSPVLRSTAPAGTEQK